MLDARVGSFSKANSAIFIDQAQPLGQKTVMNCQYPNLIDIAPLRAFLSRVLASMTVVLFVSIAFGAFRHPVATSDPLAAIEMKRQALVGSDALLERGVVPPTQSDWIVMDCSNGNPEQTTAGRLRKSVCEVSKSVHALN